MDGSDAIRVAEDNQFDLIVAKLRYVADPGIYRLTLAEQTFLIRGPELDSAIARALAAPEAAE